MIDEYILKSEALISSSRQEKRPFKFASRPYGLFLLGTLTLTWIVELIILVIVVLLQPDITNEELSLDTLIFLGVGIIWLLFLALAIIGFLLWIYKIHHDLNRLFPFYAISPVGAVASVAIPLYNLYGIWKVFKTMSRAFVPGLDVWIYVLYVATSLSRLVEKFTSNSGNLGWAEQLLVLVTTTIWIVMTLKIHRALAVRALSSGMSAPGPSEFAAEPSLLETGESVGEKASPFPSPSNTEKRNSRSRWLIIGLIGLFLSVCSISTCALVTFGAYNLLQWFNLDYFNYLMALDDHVALEDSVSNVSVEFSWIQPPGQETEVWLILGLETPMTCTAGTADPCEILADEMAAFTLQEYARIDEMDGLQVTVTTVSGNSSVLTMPALDKQMTVPAWRKALKLNVPNVIGIRTLDIKVKED